MLFVIWALGWVWFATSIAIAEPVNVKQNTDAIIVVTGGNGRVNAGLDLLDDNHAPKLFISPPCDVYLSYAAHLASDAP